MTPQIQYKSDIAGIVIQLQRELTQIGIQNLCQAHDTYFKGIKVEESYKGFTRVKTITYIFERKSQ